jgi:lipase
MLNTVEWGNPSGAAVVCLHGVTGHGGRFRAFAERLPDHRVVAVDLRGHGRSTWDPPWGIEQHLADLVEVADALGVGQAATWVGHSFGGRLVCELALRNAQRVGRAVLLDPAMHIDPGVASERAELLFDDVSFGSADEAIDARLADGSLYTTPRETLEHEAAAHLVTGPDGRARWRFSRAAVLVAWSEMARSAPAFPSCPTLLVLGVRSWIPVDVGRSSSRLETVTVPGGHSVLWDDLEATADAVARFLGT